MKPRADLCIVTLGVADVAKSATFHAALGWERTTSSMDDIVWFRTPHSYVGLFGYEALAEAAALPSSPRAQFGGITLAICCGSEAEVDDFFKKAEGAGGWTWDFKETRKRTSRPTRTKELTVRDGKRGRGARRWIGPATSETRMITASLKSLRTALLARLADLLAPAGYHRRGQSFDKEAGPVRHSFHIAFINHARDFDVTADVAVRHHAVEDLLDAGAPPRHGANRPRPSARSWATSRESDSTGGRSGMSPTWSPWRSRSWSTSAGMASRSWFGSATPTRCCGSWRPMARRPGSSARSRTGGCVSWRRCATWLAAVGETWAQMRSGVYC